MIKMLVTCTFNHPNSCVHYMYREAYAHIDKNAFNSLTYACIIVMANVYISKNVDNYGWRLLSCISTQCVVIFTGPSLHVVGVIFIENVVSYHDLNLLFNVKLSRSQCASVEVSYAYKGLFYWK